MALSIIGGLTSSLIGGVVDKVVGGNKGGGIAGRLMDVGKGLFDSLFGGKDKGNANAGTKGDGLEGLLRNVLKDVLGDLLGKKDGCECASKNSGIGAEAKHLENAGDGLLDAAKSFENKAHNRPTGTDHRGNGYDLVDAARKIESATDSLKRNPASDKAYQALSDGVKAFQSEVQEQRAAMNPRAYQGMMDKLAEIGANVGESRESIQDGDNAQTVARRMREVTEGLNDLARMMTTLRDAAGAPDNARAI